MTARPSIRVLAAVLGQPVLAHLDTVVDALDVRLGELREPARPAIVVVGDVRPPPSLRRTAAVLCASGSPSLPQALVTLDARMESGFRSPGPGARWPLARIHTEDVPKLNRHERRKASALARRSWPWRHLVLR